MRDGRDKGGVPECDNHAALIGKAEVWDSRGDAEIAENKSKKLGRPPRSPRLRVPPSMAA
jgi:hypothetical protein